jgi:hypothetical protein
MDNLQILLIALFIILFSIFFISINYAFYIIIKDNKNKLKMVLDMLVFGSMDVLAIFILLNIFNHV